MNPLLNEVRRHPLLRRRALAPGAWVGGKLRPEAHPLLFVAPMRVLVSRRTGPTPMDLPSWPGAALRRLIAALTVLRAARRGRSAWFVEAPELMVHRIFAMAPYRLPARVPGANPPRIRR